MMKQAVKFVFNRAGYRLKKIQPSHTTVSNKLIKCRIGNFDLWFDETHALPHAIDNLIHYGTNVGRLGHSVHQKYRDLVLIDVGANIGDTVAFCRSVDSFPIICIEGDDRYYKILQRNASQFENLQIVKTYVGEKQQRITVQANAHPGTAYLTQSENGKTITLQTLDHLISDGTLPKGAKMLKIDTDGYDLKVLQGAAEYLARDRPVLFIEYDRTLFEQKGDKGTDTLDWLRGLGYVDAVFYDNFGRFMMSADLGSEQIFQLHNYISNGAFQYFDIAFFHKEDEDIARSFRQKEMEYFN